MISVIVKGSRVGDNVTEFESLEAMVRALQSGDDVATTMDVVDMEGSEKFLNVVSSVGDNINLRPYMFRELNPSERDPSKWIITTPEGALVRLVSKVGTSTESVFKYDTFPNPMGNKRANVRKPNTPIRFNAPSGMVMLFRKQIQDAMEENLSNVPKSERVFKFGNTCYVADSETGEILRRGDEPEWKYTLDVYAKMSCFFVCMVLYITPGKFMDKVRERMGIDTSDTIAGGVNKDYFICNKTKEFSRFITSTRARRNVLIDRIERICAKVQGGLGFDCSKPVFMASMSRVFGLMNLRVIMVGSDIKYNIKTLMNEVGSDIQSGLRRSGKFNRGDMFNVVSDSIDVKDCPRILYVFENDMKKIHNGKQPVVFMMKVSDQFNDNLHVDPVLSLKQAVTFDDVIVPMKRITGQIVFSINDKGELLDDTKFQWNTVKVVSSVYKLNAPLYLTNTHLNVYPFKEPMKIKLIENNDELEKLVESTINLVKNEYKNRDTELFNYQEYHISSKAFKHRYSVSVSNDEPCIFHYTHSIKTILDKVFSLDSEHVSIEPVKVPSAHGALKTITSERMKHTTVALVQHDNNIKLCNGNKDRIDYTNEQFKKQMDGINMDVPITPTEKIGSFSITFKKHGDKTIYFDLPPDGNDGICMRGLLLSDKLTGLKKRAENAGGILIEQKMKKLEKANKVTGKERKPDTIARLQKHLACAVDTDRWVTDSLARMDPVMDLIGEESIMILPPSARYKNGLTRKPQINLLSSIDSEDMEVAKSYNPKETDDAPIPMGTSNGMYNNGALWELDFKSFYPQIGMGACNNALRLDMWGMYPQFPIPCNNMLQELGKYPCISYLADAGIINVYPEDVDIGRLMKFNPYMHIQTYSLRRFLSPGVNNNRDYTSSVVNSVQLINWSMDMLEAKQEQSPKPFSFEDKYELVRVFQFEILNIKTGRFINSKDFREVLGRELRTKTVPFKDYGMNFIEEDTIFLGELKYNLESCLIIPTDKRLLEMTGTDIHVNPDIIRDDEKYAGVYRDALLNSLALIVGYATQIQTIRALEGVDLPDGTIITKADVKMCINSSVGKCRKNGSKGVRYTRTKRIQDVVKYDDLDLSKYNFNITDTGGGIPHVLAANLRLSKSMWLIHYNIATQNIRCSYDQFRTFILVVASITMDRIAMDIFPRQILRVQVDSALVFPEDKDTIEDAFEKFSRHSPDSTSMSIPGYGPGYTMERIPASKITPASKYNGVCRNICSNPLVGPTDADFDNGIFEQPGTTMIKTSSVKRAMDTINTIKVYYDDEEMYKYHENNEHPLLKLHDCNEYELLSNGYSAADLARFVSVNTECEEVAQFNTDYTEYIAKYLVVTHKARGQFIGAPGTGKSTFAKVVAEYYVEKYGDREVCFSAPFHGITNAMKDPVYKYSKTSHSLAGCKRNIGLLRTDAYRYISRHPQVVQNSTFKPLESKIGLWISDEVQSTPIAMQEGWKILATKPDSSFIFIHDKYQAPSVNDVGVDVNGAVVSRLGCNFIFNKNIEYRNTSKDYIKGKNATRRGDVMKYIDPTMCDYESGHKALSSVKVLLQGIAECIIEEGHTEKVVVVQNWKVATIVVINVIRCMLLLGYEYECALIHTGSGSQSNDVDILTSTEQAIEFECKAVYYPKSSKQNVHKQNVHGIPLLFGMGCRYTVLDGFRFHYRDGQKKENDDDGQKKEKNDDEEDEPPKRKQLFKNDIVEYISYEDVPCKRQERKEKGKPKKDTPRARNDKLKNEETIRILKFAIVNTDIYEEILLTEDEASRFLMYTFIAQQVGLIGLTLTDVTTIQLGIGYSNFYKPGPITYNKGYIPIKTQLERVSKRLGDKSWMANICRMLHVVLTRGRTGIKTRILDIESSVFYQDILYNTVVGKRGYTLGVLYPMDVRECNGNINKIRKGILHSIRRRSHIWKRAAVGIGHKRVPIIDFPKKQLEPGTTQCKEKMNMYLDCLIESSTEKRKR